MANKFLVKIKKMKLTRLKPYYNNPRKNYASIDMLEQAFNEYEFMTPLTVDENMVIITGHSRYYAAKNIGIEEVDVIVKTGLPDSEVKQYRIADNKTQENGVWDIEGNENVMHSYAQESKLFRKMFPEYAFSDIKPTSEFKPAGFDDISFIEDDDDVEVFYTENPQYRPTEETFAYKEEGDSDSDDIEKDGIIAHDLIICPYCYHEFKGKTE